ncbi:MAG: hypothetical protein MN733_01490 [Nitrososphaera sp.]|nr:hypothetical protein [Nitrososphaera sp.]
MSKTRTIRKLITRIPAYAKPFNGAVALALLGLSLSHQAAGVAEATGVANVESWLMAIGIDLAMIGAEIAILAGIRTHWTRSILAVTLVLSAGFNVMGFWQIGAPWLNNTIALVLGLFVPAAIYGLVDTVNARTARRAGVRKAVRKAVRKLS